MALEFKEIRAGDISLAYIEQGHGTPVIFVHGSGATDLRTWGAQMEPFAEHYRAIAYSQRNHYPNAWIGYGSGVYSTTVDSGDLAALIGALNLGGVHLVGNSYGADIILRLAVEHPEMVRTLVLAEPGLATWLATLPGGAKMFANSAATIIPAKKAVEAGDFEAGARLFIDAALGKGLFDHLPASTRNRILDNVRLVSAEPTELDEFSGEITPAEATYIQAPTLILTGDQSPQRYSLVCQELARLLPHVETAQISEAAHILHVMNPQAFNRAVLGFLEKYGG